MLPKRKKWQGGSYQSFDSAFCQTETLRHARGVLCEHLYAPPCLEKYIFAHNGRVTIGRPRLFVRKLEGAWARSWRRRDFPHFFLVKQS